MGERVSKRGISPWVVCCLDPTTYNRRFNIGLTNATVPLRRKSIGQVTKQTSHFLYNDMKR